jgi:molybdate transport system permease protein
VNLDDLRLSLQVAGLATVLCVLVGTPLAWILARWRFTGRTVLEVLVTLPLVLPPTVVGYYLLRALGRGSPLGRFLEDDLGVRLVFTWQGAALGAAILSAPLLIRTAQTAFEQVDPELELVAATLGRRRLAVFLTVTLPLSIRGISAGIALAFARAVGEFGATVMIAGNIPGRTRTLSVAVYDALQAGDTERANIAALVLILISVASLLAFGYSAGLLRRARS